MSVSVDRDRLEADLARLHHASLTWPEAGTTQKITVLQSCIDRTILHVKEWADLCCVAKGIDPDSPLAGEEWIVGPVALIRALRLAIAALEAGGTLKPAQVSSLGDHQTARVLPTSLLDRVLWTGITADVWMKAGKAVSQSLASSPSPTGQVALVLGAGNISSIGPTDVLHKLLNEQSAVVLKLNPVNDYLTDVLTAIFTPLIEAGLLTITTGDASVGAYLCHHPVINSIHITGSHRTYDAIVWGSDPDEQSRRKQEHRPILNKPVTAELGCVTPIFVVPGQWSDRQLAFQARHIASMVAHNASYNCTAAQVVITARHWPQRLDFLEYFRQALRDIPARAAYYPGSEARYRQICDRYPQAERLSAQSPANALPWTAIFDLSQTDDYFLQTEAFCSVVGEVPLDVATVPEYLEQAIPFANESVWGTLSCTLLADPRSQSQYAEEFNQAIAALRYGTIGINIWSGAAFALGVTPWGAYPGHPPENIESGCGFVHNPFAFDHPLKSVVRAPFDIRPTPAWFAHHRTLKSLGQALVPFEASPSWSKLPAVIWEAVRG